MMDDDDDDDALSCPLSLSLSLSKAGSSCDDEKKGMIPIIITKFSKEFSSFFNGDLNNFSSRSLFKSKLSSKVFVRVSSLIELKPRRQRVVVVVFERRRRRRRRQRRRAHINNNTSNNNGGSGECEHRRECERRQNDDAY